MTSTAMLPPIPQAKVSAVVNPTLPHRARRCYGVFVRGFGSVGEVLKQALNKSLETRHQGLAPLAAMQHKPCNQYAYVGGRKRTDYNSCDCL